MVANEKIYYYYLFFLLNSKLVHLANDGLGKLYLWPKNWTFIAPTAYIACHFSFLLFSASLLNLKQHILGLVLSSANWFTLGHS
ncbi:MAG: hypothetical protein D3923_16780 [Candidatus Electrothrix sp. AR3]|nr:hypothetical protein [Candidatus Electrothrix sp. AR3]